MSMSEHYWVHSDPETPATVVTCVGPHKPPRDSDAEWHPPVVKTGLLCSRCRARLSTLLIELPAIAAWLQVNIVPSGGTGERISGTRERPIPLKTTVLDLIGPTNGQKAISVAAPPARYQLWAGAQHVTSYQTRAEADAARWQLRHDDDPDAERDLGYYRITLLKMTRDQIGIPSIYDRINGWAHLVHEEALADWPEKNDLANLAKWLHRQLDWLVRQPWVDDMLNDLIDVDHYGRKIAPFEAEQRRLKSECPECDLRALVFTRGVGVECERTLGGCGRSWHDKRFDFLILVLGSAALQEVE